MGKGLGIMMYMDTKPEVIEMMRNIRVRLRARALKLLALPSVRNR